MPVSNLREIAPGLQLDHEGWWWSQRTVREVSYPEEGNDLCFSIEDSSFWFAHRNRCILQMLKLLPPAGPIFDIGGGNGYVARAIQEAGLDVVLIEPGLAGVRNARKRGVRHVVRATLDEAGILPQSLPAVGLFDVVEHIADDREFLSRIHRLLAPEGRIYLTVPAYQWLWSHEDVLAGHSRRYTLQSLGRLLLASRYAVEFATCIFAFLPVPILLHRVLPYRLGLAMTKPDAAAIRSDHQAGHPLIERVLQMLTGWELRRIAQQRPIRTGGSCLIVARKFD